MNRPPFNVYMYSTCTGTLLLLQYAAHEGCPAAASCWSLVVFCGLGGYLRSIILISYHSTMFSLVMILVMLIALSQQNKCEPNALKKKKIAFMKQT